MTVVVGILCQDGVVVGSDSSATFIAASGQPTIEQPMQKTFIHGNNLIVSASGQGGLSQRLNSILSSIVTGTEYKKNADHFGIAALIAKLAIQDFSNTHAKQGQIGALVAFACRKKFHLCEFAFQDFQPEHKTEQNWFTCLGSGQQIAEPFLAMLARVFFESKPPTLQEGIFAATWALDQAIRLNPGGINGPSQIAVLSVDGDDALAARMLEDDELGEHLNSVKGAEAHLAQYRQIMAGEGSSVPVPGPPEPPAEAEAQAKSVKSTAT